MAVAGEPLEAVVDDGSVFTEIDAGGLAVDSAAGQPAVDAFVSAVRGGEPWYPALLQAVAQWVEPEEIVDGEVFRYLLGGEAFNWMRLAERLLAAAEELVPEAEAERLLFLGEAPEESPDEEFARAIGHQKYRAHLNFQYGVTVEEGLLLVVELELHKSRASLDGRRSQPDDVAAYERVYGVSFEELLALFRQETGSGLGARVSLSEMQQFTYWCWKYRVRMQEPARVASDTRRALALLSRMEVESHVGSRRGRVSERADVIEVD